jgi:carbon storage regulator
MLVLSRMRDEVIMVGDVEIRVVDIRPDKVRIGITAPRNVPVHRKEVYDAIHRENRQRSSEPQAGAASSPPSPCPPASQP